VAVLPVDPFRSPKAPPRFEALVFTVSERCECHMRLKNISPTLFDKPSLLALPPKVEAVCGFRRDSFQTS